MPTAEGPANVDRVQVRALLEELSPPAEVRRHMATTEARDMRTWRALCARGLVDLGVPPAAGGRGGSFTDVAVVVELLGAALTCVPFLSSAVLASGALLHAGDQEAADHLAALSGGSKVATVALGGPAGRWDEPSLTATLDRGGGGWTIDGEASHVLDGHTADLVLAVARSHAGTGLFAVNGDAPGLSREPLVTLDQTRPQTRLRLRGVPARPLGGPDGGDAVVGRVIDLAAVALAAEAVGGAGRCLEMAVAHARERVQFGRPIGSFQAVKHRLADGLVAVESARAVTEAAVRAVDSGAGDLGLLASTAKAWCAQAYLTVAETTIQVHGAVGFTWDHDAHLYLKRAKSSALLFGDPAWHRRRVARLLEL
jgi:alkylation response protein AidB-like acyl-CoA dehydrogenase